MNCKDIKSSKRAKKSRQVGSICLLPTLFGREPEPDLAASFVPGSCRKKDGLVTAIVTSQRPPFLMVCPGACISIVSISITKKHETWTEFLCSPSVSNKELGPLLFVLHAMAKLPCRYYGRDRPRLTIKGWAPSLFPCSAMKQRPLNAQSSSQLLQVDWSNRSFLASFHLQPFLRRPVQISLPLLVCIFPFFCSEALGHNGDLNLFFSPGSPPPRKPPLTLIRVGVFVAISRIPCCTT